MLDEVHSGTMLVTAPTLHKICREILTRSGLPEGDADLVADSLIDAELRGHESHGIRLLPHYVRRLRLGGANPRPAIALVQDSPALALLDGDGGLGQVVCARGMDIAIDKARRNGVGAVAVRNSNHIGTAGYYAMRAARQDMIGFVTTNAEASMAPWGGVTPTFGNNPFAFAIPAGEELSVLLDMATSVAAGGKIALAAQRGERIPKGWATDEEGEPTDDPEVALRGLFLPFGGHKGYGLSVVMDVLSGVLSGALFAAQLQRPVSLAVPQNIGHFLLAIHIENIMPIKTFKERMDTLIRQAKASRLRRDSGKVYLPGERGFEAKRHRLERGIPLADSTAKEIERLAGEFNLIPW